MEKGGRLGRKGVALAELELTQSAGGSTELTDHYLQVGWAHF